MTDEEYLKHFPVQGWRLKCGLRLDLPKKERRHLYEPAGQDMRNKGERGYVLCDVRVCTRCGFDDAKKVKE
jgi:hypothetical protein